MFKFARQESLGLYKSGASFGTHQCTSSPYEDFSSSYGSVNSLIVCLLLSALALVFEAIQFYDGVHYCFTKCTAVDTHLTMHGNKPISDQAEVVLCFTVSWNIPYANFSTSGTCSLTFLVVGFIKYLKKKLVSVYS